MHQCDALEEPLGLLDRVEHGAVVESIGHGSGQQGMAESVHLQYVPELSRRALLAFRGQVVGIGNERKLLVEDVGVRVDSWRRNHLADWKELVCCR